MRVLPPQTAKAAWEWGWSLLGYLCTPPPEMPTSADSWQAEGASLESCCSASSAHAIARTEAQRLGCLLVWPPQTAKVAWELEWSLLGYLCTPPPEMRTSADSWQAEWASLESCCSASSAHATARTEAQRLGLLACLATSNCKRILGMGVVPLRLPFQPCSENANVCR